MFDGGFLRKIIVKTIARTFLQEKHMRRWIKIVRNGRVLFQLVPEICNMGGGRKKLLVICDFAAFPRTLRRSTWKLNCQAYWMMVITSIQHYKVIQYIRTT